MNPVTQEIAATAARISVPRERDSSPSSGEEPQVIHADQAAHPERITVRLRKPST